MQATELAKLLLEQAQRDMDHATVMRDRLNADFQEKRGRFADGLLVVKGNLYHQEMQDSADDLMTAAMRLASAEESLTERTRVRDWLAKELEALSEDGA